MQGPSAGPTTAQELLALTQSQQQYSLHQQQAHQVNQQAHQVNQPAIGLNPTTNATSNLFPSGGTFVTPLRDTVLTQPAQVVNPGVSKEMQGSTATTSIPNVGGLHDTTVPTRLYSNPGLDSRSLLSDSGISTPQQQSKLDRSFSTPQSAKTYRPESGFVSPGELKRSLDRSFIEGSLALHKMINNSPADVVRRVIRENWSKCLSGSMYHRAFILNISLSRAEDFAKPSVLSFGGRIVKLCTVEIAEHLDSASIDTISEKILEKASPEFLDKAMAERLKTIDSRNLLNMLARAERLGYTMDDVLDGDVQDEEDVFMVDMDIVTTDIPPNTESAPSQEAQDATDKDIAKDTQDEVITITTTSTTESELELESEGESEFEAGVEPELEHTVESPSGKNSLLYNVYFPQEPSLAEGFSARINCPFCRMIFPSVKAKQIHTTNKTCLKPRKIKKNYGCRFCGISLSSIQSLRLHAAKRVCGDYSCLGQSLAHPNGAGFSNKISTPYAVPKAMKPQKLDSESKPDPIQTKASGASATPATTEADTIKMDKQKAHDKTSEHPNMEVEPQAFLPSLSSQKLMPPKASEAIPQPSQEFLDKHKGNPIAHLTREQIYLLKWEIQETKKWLIPLMEEAIKEGDESKADLIRNRMATEISLTRKKYGIPTPWKGGTHSELDSDLGSGICGSLGMTGLVATGGSTAESTEGPSFTPAKPKDTLEHPQKMDAKLQMQETTPKSVEGGSLPEAGRASAIRPNSSPGNETEESDIEQQPLSLRRRKAYKGQVKAPHKPTRDAAAKTESPMYISSSDDSDTDDSIPARLPRPALR